LTVIARRLRNCGRDRDRQGYHGDRGGDDGIGETPDQAPAVMATIVPPPCDSRCDWGDGERNSENTGDHEGFLHLRYSRRAIRIPRRDKSNKGHANTTGG
jgi:hypothetical protein